MAKINKIDRALRDGTKVTVESGNSSHSNMFKTFNDAIYDESDFLYPATQQKRTLEECAQQISMLENSPKDLMLIMHNGEEALGMLNLRSFPQEPIKHSMDFGVAVRKKWRGKGVGHILMEILIEHLKKDPQITRLQMSVVAENKPAIDMYTKLGFELEGRRKLAVKSWDGKFHDELLMAKFVK